MITRIPNDTIQIYQFPNDLRFHGLPKPMLISAESISVAEEYALNINLLLRDIPVHIPPMKLFLYDGVGVVKIIKTWAAQCCRLGNFTN